MNTTPLKTLANDEGNVRELFTKADVEALNSALTEQGISPHQIITVLHVPGQIVASPTAPQFRVLYRAA